MNTKSILKIATISGISVAIWSGVFALISSYFNILFGWYLVIYPLLVYGLSLESYTGIFFILLYPYVPGLLVGLIGGIIAWGLFSENRREENKLISSLKYRTRSIYSFSLFLGESTLCIVALGSLFLSTMGVFFSPEKSADILYAIGYPEIFSETYLKSLSSGDSTSLIKLIVAIFVTFFSVLLIWRIEVYISKEKRSAAPPLPAAQQQYPLSVQFVMFLGVILLSVLGIYMVVGIIPGLVMLCFILPWIPLRRRNHSTE
ncbi:MAG: hypothetical protein M0Q48_07660 [Verrucomicrobia bacterium]|nr:hypothetical protein [Verrucomicrobiota bacterium]